MLVIVIVGFVALVAALFVLTASAHCGPGEYVNKYGMCSPRMGAIAN